MPKDDAYLEAEKKIAEALTSRATEPLERPDRFPRGAPPSDSSSPHATRLTAARMKPVRSPRS